VSSEPLLIFLIVGAVAGWLAGRIVRGYGVGLLGNIVVGVIGAFIGGWVFTRFGLVHGRDMLGDLVGATVGAVILLFLLRFVGRARPGGRLFGRWR
jgi:uncharacterized membrane protein YeaQ/YmgE (transglycosylase-associated protein family)